MMKVNFNCFDRMVYSFRLELDEAYNRVMDSGWFVLGKEVELFESEFAAFCNTKFCIGVANGLEAIELILRSFEFDRNSEIIVPANTYIATWLGVVHSGSRIVPVDADIDTYNIDFRLIEDKISPDTKAIFATHLYGGLGPYKQIEKIAKSHDLHVFWDAAQAHGIRSNGEYPSPIGKASAFSFYPTKNLGGLGDGGAVVTNDENIADKVLHLRNYGSKKRYVNKYIGLNSRLDELQAAFLRVKLRKLREHNHRRREIAQLYHEFLKGLPNIHTPKHSDDHVWHLYVIRHSNRNKLQEYLSRIGIQTDIHYPRAPYNQSAFDSSQFDQLNFPVTETIHNNALSLPLNPYITDEEVLYVCKAITMYCDAEN